MESPDDTPTLRGYEDIHGPWWTFPRFVVIESSVDDPLRATRSLSRFLPDPTRRDKGSPQPRWKSPLSGPGVTV